MALIPFPNVPNAPGVPAIPRIASIPAAARLALGLIQGAIWTVLKFNTSWGVFDSKGRPLASPSVYVSTDSVEFTKDMKVSDFPVERGGFASYNKVELPNSPSVTLVMGGSDAERSFFLDAIDRATKSTDVYSVLTPNATYVNCTIERYSYSRKQDKGANLLIVSLELKEIREVSPTYAKIKTPKEATATSTVDSGKVQPKTVTNQSTLKKVANYLGG